MGRLLKDDVLDFMIKNVVQAKTVLDVGGSWRGYCGATHVLDIENSPRNGEASTKTWVTGDICRPKTWDQFSDKQFDFIVCTHVLEDVYDPFIVLDQMSRVGKAGYVECPSAFAETMRVMADNEFSPRINGYLHHRYIVELSATTDREELFDKNTDVDQDGHLVFSIKTPQLMHADLCDFEARDVDNWQMLSSVGLFWFESVSGYLRDPDCLDYFKRKRTIWESSQFMRLYYPIFVQNRFKRRFGVDGVRAQS